MESATLTLPDARAFVKGTHVKGKSFCAETLRAHSNGGPWVSYPSSSSRLLRVFCVSEPAALGMANPSSLQDLKINGVSTNGQHLKRVLSESLQYEPGFLGRNLHAASVGLTSVFRSTALSYLTSILSSKVYDVAIESPLELATKLSERTGSGIFLKREDLQPVQTLFSICAKLFLSFWSHTEHSFYTCMRTDLS